MPAYDFLCKACDKTFEVVRSISDMSIVSCPECGGQAKRVFTPVGVHFKGSGFYSTDSKKAKSAPTVTGKSKEPTPEAGSCPASSSDTGCSGCPAATVKS